MESIYCSSINTNNIYKFEPHRRQCVVSLSKNIDPSLVLVQPRKTRPFKTERLLMGRQELNQTKTNKQNIYKQNIVK